jgi:hypothetical protein
MLVLIELGFRLRPNKTQISGSAAMESAVFALFGLLLAFTFSGAMSRYDAHRQLIVAESNDIGTAYLRLDLLPPAAQPALRQAFRDYTAVRARRFDGLDGTPEASAAMAESQRLQSQIWTKAIAATTAPGANPDATKLLLPVINDMIDITATRKNAFNMHPPAIVTFLLFALACGCALLAGLSMTGTRRSWLHMLAFAAVVSLTIYATMDIEYPRRGLVRLDTQHQAFTDLRNSMN